MSQVKRPIDSKLEGKVPPVEAKDAPSEGDATETGAEPADKQEERDK